MLPIIWYALLSPLQCMHLFMRRLLLSQGNFHSFPDTLSTHKVCQKSTEISDAYRCLESISLKNNFTIGRVTIHH